MFDDEACNNKIAVNQKFVSYIGTIAEDHAFREFIDFAVYCCENGKNNEFDFLIASKSSIPIKFKKKIDYLQSHGRITLACGVPFTNEEINYYFMSSLVVWNAYRRSMQSGVLPKAYMFGVPVICSTNMDSEFIINRQTGIVISYKYDNSEIMNAVKDLINHSAIYRVNCKYFFKQNFYYKAIGKSYLEFIEK